MGVAKPGIADTCARAEAWCLSGRRLLRSQLCLLLGELSLQAAHRLSGSVLCCLCGRGLHGHSKYA